MWIDCCAFIRLAGGAPECGRARYPFHPVSAPHCLSPCSGHTCREAELTSGQAAGEVVSGSGVRLCPHLVSDRGGGLEAAAELEALALDSPSACMPELQQLQGLDQVGGQGAVLCCAVPCSLQVAWRQAAMHPQPRLSPDLIAL